MLLHSWLKDLKARRGRAAERPNRRRTAYRPVLEVLEDRTLMAATFDWKMADRFGIDQDGDNGKNLIDMHNNPAFVQATRFEVVLDASASTASGPIQSYHWTFRNQNGNPVSNEVFDAAGQALLQATVTNPVHRLRFDTASTDPARNALREKSFYVTLDVTTTSGVRTSQTQFVRVKDILIVTIGDSMAAGEGNPEIGRGEAASATWGDTWDDRLGPPPGDRANDGLRAHRSSLSYAARLALKLERDDPHTSVTFVSVASSGAEITEGLLGEQIGRADHSRIAAVPQLEQVTAAVGNRRIDALTISIGVNDVHFADVVTALTLIDAQFPLLDLLAEVHDNGDDTGVLINTFAKVQAFAQFGLNPAGTAIALPGQTGGEGGLNNLSAEYARLNTALRNRFPARQISRIFISQYPDPSLNAAGQVGQALNDILPGLEMDTVEARWAREEFLFRLNDLVRTAGESFGWTVVNGIPERFGQDGVFGHGYGAGSERWVRTATDAYDRQGDDAKAAGLLGNDAVATAAAAAVIAVAVVGGSISSVIGGVLGGPFGAAVGAAVGAQLVGVAVLRFDDVYARVRNILGHRDTTGTIHPNPAGHTAIMEQHLLAFQAVGNPSYFSHPFEVRVTALTQRLLRANTAAAAAQVRLHQNSLNPAFMELVVDGFLLDAWRTGSVSQLTIDAGRATMHVLDIPAGLNVTVNDASIITAGKNNTVQTLQSTLTIGSQGRAARLTVANSADPVARTSVQITDTKITGLSAGEIVYQAGSLAALTVFTGTRNDVISIHSTAAGTPVTVNGGTGDDTITVNYVRSVVFRPGPSPGSLVSIETDSIKSALIIDGGSGTLDALNAAFSGFLGQSPEVVNLTQSSLSTERYSGAPISYSNLDKLTLSLGGGGDTVTVPSTHAGATVLNTGGGADNVNVRTISGNTTINGEADIDTIRVNSLAPSAGGVVNGIAGVLTVVGGSNAGGRDALIIDDSGDLAGLDFNNLVDFSLGIVRGFGMPLGIKFRELEAFQLSDPFAFVSVSGVAGSGIVPVINALGLIFHGTDGNDRILIGWQAGPEGAQAVVRINHKTSVINYLGGTTVSVFAGKGNDQVVMKESAGLRWRAEFFGEQGNDHLVGSRQNDKLDGGQGKDLLEGGAGDDELLGGDGNDHLRGDVGNDRLDGGDGKDLLEGGDGDDELVGGPGHDRFDGGAGADRVFAADGARDLILADLDDWLLDFDPRDQVIRRGRR